MIYLGNSPVGVITDDGLWKKIRGMASIFRNSTDLPHDIRLSPNQIDASSGTGYAFYRAYETGQNSPTMNVVIDISQTSAFPFSNMFYQAYGVKNLTINGDLSVCTTYQDMFSNCQQIEKIDMVFDFTSVTTENGGRISNSGTNNKSIELRFAPNTASCNINVQMFAGLTDSSLVSLANCLKGSVTGKSVTFNSTPKARCATLMGTNNSGTFIADENGTMSLESFITTVKGWTLA